MFDRHAIPVCTAWPVLTFPTIILFYLQMSELNGNKKVNRCWPQKPLINDLNRNEIKNQFDASFFMDVRLPAWASECLAREKERERADRRKGEERERLDDIIVTIG